MTQSTTTTLKLPATAHQRLLERVVADGYGLRGKSKWVIDAIERFLQLENFPELVDIANDMENHDEILSLRIPNDVMVKLDNAVIQTRKLFPGMEGVRSNIIRASIIQSLIRFNYGHRS